MIPSALAIRVLGAIVVVAAILGGLAALRQSGYRAGVEDERAANTAALAEAGLRYARQIERDAKVNEERVDAFETEIAGLRADAAARPVGPVRLCWNPSRPGPVPAVPTLAGGAFGGAAAAGGVPEVPGRAADGFDAGPGLQLITSRCDRLSAQARQLLKRNRELSKRAEERRGP